MSVKDPSTRPGFSFLYNGGPPELPRFAAMGSFARHAGCRTVTAGHHLPPAPSKLLLRQFRNACLPDRARGIWFLIDPRGHRFSARLVGKAPKQGFLGGGRRIPVKSLAAQFHQIYITPQQPFGPRRKFLIKGESYCHFPQRRASTNYPPKQPKNIYLMAIGDGFFSFD